VAGPWYQFFDAALHAIAGYEAMNIMGKGSNPMVVKGARSLAGSALSVACSGLLPKLNEGHGPCRTAQ
jgi:hypothetical protein